MTFGESIKSCLNGYVKFDGRASRSEYWWFWLFCMILILIASAIDLSMSNPYGRYDRLRTLETLVGLAILLPSISVSVRRLHDLNKSGWWYLISFIPLIGIIILYIWFATRGTVGANNFGEDPLAAA